MEIAENTRVSPSTRHEWRLWHLTDLHIEERDHAERELDDVIAMIRADDHSMWVGGGDYGGYITTSDPRYSDGYLDVVPHDRVPDYVVEVVSEKLMPIRDKCVGFGAGNHEWSLMRDHHRGVAAEIAANLGCQHLYLGQRGWVHVQFALKKTKTMTLKVYWYHGWSAGRGKSRKMLHAERAIAARPSAHVQMLGHDHQPWIDSSFYQEETYRSSRTRRSHIRHRPVVTMNGGSFTYGQTLPDGAKAAKKPSEMRNELWVEKKNYPPEPVRTPICHVEVDHGNGRHSKKDNSAGRPMGLHFRTEMVAPTVSYE